MKNILNACVYRQCILPRLRTFFSKYPGMFMLPAGRYCPTTKAFWPSVAMPTPTSVLSFHTTWVKWPTGGSTTLQSGESEELFQLFSAVCQIHGILNLHPKLKKL